MLAYIIVRELLELWVEMGLTVEEGISELSSISSIEVKIGKSSCQQIPRLRHLGRKLLRLARVRLPGLLPNRNVTVAIRKKLNGVKCK